MDESSGSQRIQAKYGNGQPEEDLARLETTQSEGVPADAEETQREKKETKPS